MPHVNLHWRRLPDGLLGYTDCQGRRITMDPDLLQAERRAVLSHELVHAERGDTCPRHTAYDAWYETRQEADVEQVAARRLISLSQLVEALKWSRDETELADELWVDVETVRSRLAGLTEQEKQYIEARLWAREETA